jgi:excisionase family DNA binding protein
MTLKEASREFAIPVSTLRTWIRDRKIPYYKGRKMVRIARGDLEKVFVRVPSAKELFS